jgi:hypothetical protein
MACRRQTWGRAAAWAIALAFAPGARPAFAQAPLPAPPPAEAGPAPGSLGPLSVPLDELPADVQPRARAVLEHPTLRARGPAEAFACQPALYDWLLDHPDLAVRMWRCLGAECTDIRADGAGVFVWSDRQGSAIRWQTVLRGPDRRVWYAEGSVKPGPLLPAVPLRAVAVLRHGEGRDAAGRPVLRHQVELAVHADSHAAALAARLLGASAPRVAEQYVAQIGVFYSALARYLTRHPEQAVVLFAQLQRPESTDEPLFRAGAPIPRAEPRN